MDILSLQPSLESLWRSPPVPYQSFQPDRLTELPELARCYLNHAIAPGTPLASAVRLTMHGEINLKGWHPFQAEQVIAWRQGMIWQAMVWMKGLPICGWDRLVNGRGAMQWKMLGVVPVVSAAGADVTRSAIGRMHGECIWLPSVFCHDDTSWTALNGDQACAQLTDLGETTDLVLTIHASGQLQHLRFQRWGNPDGAEYRTATFGGSVQHEGTFSGYTIPTQLRVGWYGDRDPGDADGDFVRITIDNAVYR